MTIHFQCEHCGQAIRVPDDAAGTQGRCPGCDRTVSIPQARPSDGSKTPPPLEKARSGASSNVGAARRLLWSLLDFNFEQFITSTLIKVVYGVGLAILVAVYGILLLAGLGSAFGSFDDSVLVALGTLLVTLIFVPIAFFLSVIWLRMSLELVIVVFRIAENTQRVADRGQL